MQGKGEWAQNLALSAVNCAPSEFITWAKLTEMNIETGKHDEALLTLNSCPMFTFNERDLHRMPTPVLSHLPMPDYIVDTGILEPVSENARSAEDESQAEAHLLALPAPALRGTFKEAYRLLARLVSAIGWDELLRARSHVFVMEEEYRQAKADGDSSDEDDVPLKRSLSERQSPTINGTGRTEEEGADEEASVKTLHSRQPTVDPSQLSAEGARTSHPSSPVPEIRVSSDEEVNNPSEAEPNPSTNEQVAEEDTAETDRPGEPEAPKSDLQAQPEGLEKPVTAAHSQPSPISTSGLGDEPSTGTTVSSAGLPPQTGTSTGSGAADFSSKRLCERWLDNLFMVLYEDLRVLTVWRAEMAHFKAQHMPYRKTATEWEILGDLALRLHRKEEVRR